VVTGESENPAQLADAVIGWRGDRRAGHIVGREQLERLLGEDLSKSFKAGMLVAAVQKLTV
jgi:hypothetical protein